MWLPTVPDTRLVVDAVNLHVLWSLRVLEDYLHVFFTPPIVFVCMTARHMLTEVVVYMLYNLGSFTVRPEKLCASTGAKLFDRFAVNGSENCCVECVM